LIVLFLVKVRLTSYTLTISQTNSNSHILCQRSEKMSVRRSFIVLRKCQGEPVDASILGTP
jgi:hypothetical protein